MRKFIVILLIALMATLGLWYVFNDVPEEPVVTTEEDKPVAEEKQFVISAVTTDVYGVKDDSSFKVEGNVSAEELEKNLIIEPAVPFSIIPISRGFSVIACSGQIRVQPPQPWHICGNTSTFVPITTRAL